MIYLKKPLEIAIMQEGGKRLKYVVGKLLAKIKVGMATREIDEIALKLIKEVGAEPSFKKVKGYKWSTCLCINEQIVHTPPSERIIKDRDVLTLDIGLYYKGFHTDFADTIAVGKVNEKVKRFLETGKKTLELAIKKVKKGARLGEISQTIQNEIEEAGYSIVKELTGHGIGRDLHEDPSIPGFLDRPKDKTLTIKPGLVIAIEVIYAMGDGAMLHESPDDWSIRTADRSLSACFEHTVAVTHEPDRQWRTVQGATDINTLILT